MIEKQFFFKVNFIAALFLFGYCLLFTGQSMALNLSMFYIFGIIGSYLGDKYLNQGIKPNRLFLFVSGVLFPLIISAIILYLSDYPIKSTFGRLVVFTVLIVVGVGINMYLYFRRKSTS